MGDTCESVSLRQSVCTFSAAFAVHTNKRWATFSVSLSLFSVYKALLRVYRALLCGYGTLLLCIQKEMGDM